MGQSGESSADINTTYKFRHLEDACDVVVGVAVVLRPGDSCGTVLEVIAFIAKAVAEIAISTIAGANNDVLGFRRNALLVAQLVVPLAALVVGAVVVVGNSHGSIRCS